MDAITLLRNDHRTVEQLFKRFEKAGDNAFVAKREIVDRIIEELSVHAAIEEQLFYPAARATVPGVEDIALESLEEHHIVKWVLSELDGMAPTDERFDAKVTVLIENVRHHVEEEQTEFFPKVRDELGRKALNELGDAMAAAKASAPTHPHPRTPDTPAGQRRGRRRRRCRRSGRRQHQWPRPGHRLGHAGPDRPVARASKKPKTPADRQLDHGAQAGESHPRRQRPGHRHRGDDGHDAPRPGDEDTARAAASGAKSVADTAASSARSTATTAKRSAKATTTSAKRSVSTTANAAKKAAKTTGATAKASARGTSSTAKRGAKKTAAAARTGRTS